MNGKPMWSRLKDLKCPMCGDAISQGVMSDAADFKCSRCDFRINAAKFNEIVGNLYKPKREQENFDGDTLSEWNNYAPEVREGAHDEALEHMFDPEV